jgi:hypothetical protein
MLIPEEAITRKILVVRGRRVMLDRDLAELYGVSAKRLNEQVKRNRKRFPGDFMFQLTRDEMASLRSQFATLKRGQHSKYLAKAFTEQGIAMLSGVLSSERAIEVNIAIMRVFVKFREILLSHKELALKISELEKKVARNDKEIQVIFEAIRQLMFEPEKPKPKIGFHT